MTNKRKNIKVSELAYFASDREGFKKFGVFLNKALVKNLFSILDQNNDDYINLM